MRQDKGYALKRYKAGSGLARDTNPEVRVPIPRGNTYDSLARTSSDLFNRQMAKESQNYEKEQARLGIESANNLSLKLTEDILEWDKKPSSLSYEAFEKIIDERITAHSPSDSNQYYKDHANELRNKHLQTYLIKKDKYDIEQLDASTSKNLMDFSLEATVVDDPGALSEILSRAKATSIVVAEGKGEASGVEYLRKVNETIVSSYIEGQITRANSLASIEDIRSELNDKDIKGGFGGFEHNLGPTARANLKALMRTGQSELRIKANDIKQALSDAQLPLENSLRDKSLNGALTIQELNENKPNISPGAYYRLAAPLYKEQGQIQYSKVMEQTGIRVAGFETWAYSQSHTETAVINKGEKLLASIEALSLNLTGPQRTALIEEVKSEVAFNQLATRLSNTQSPDDLDRFALFLNEQPIEGLFLYLSPTNRADLQRLSDAKKIDLENGVEAEGLNQYEVLQRVSNGGIISAVDVSRLQGQGLITKDFALNIITEVPIRKEQSDRSQTVGHQLEEAYQQGSLMHLNPSDPAHKRGTDIWYSKAIKSLNVAGQPFDGNKAKSLFNTLFNSGIIPAKAKNGLSQLFNTANPESARLALTIIQNGYDINPGLMESTFGKPFIERSINIYSDLESGIPLTEAIKNASARATFTNDEFKQLSKSDDYKEIRDEHRDDFFSEWDSAFRDDPDQRLTEEIMYESTYDRVYRSTGSEKRASYEAAKQLGLTFSSSDFAITGEGQVMAFAPENPEWGGRTNDTELNKLMINNELEFMLNNIGSDIPVDELALVPNKDTSDHYVAGGQKLIWNIINRETGQELTDKNGSPIVYQHDERDDYRLEVEQIYSEAMSLYYNFYDDPSYLRTLQLRDQSYFKYGPILPPADYSYGPIKLPSKDRLKRPLDEIRKKVQLELAARYPRLSSLSPTNVFNKEYIQHALTKRVSD